FPRWILDLAKIDIIFNPTTFQWFIDFSRTVVRRRKQSGQKRADFVQLLIDASVDERELGSVSLDSLAASMDKGEFWKQLLFYCNFILKYNFYGILYEK